MLFRVYHVTDLHSLATRVSLSVTPAARFVVYTRLIMLLPCTRPSGVHELICFYLRACSCHVTQLCFYYEYSKSIRSREQCNVHAAFSHCTPHLTLLYSFDCVWNVLILKVYLNRAAAYLMLKSETKMSCHEVPCKLLTVRRRLETVLTTTANRIKWFCYLKNYIRPLLLLCSSSCAFYVLCRVQDAFKRPLCWTVELQ